jgi:hypothetical protein
MSAIRTFNVEAGFPTLDEARRLVIEEIKRTKREGAKVLKVIHGGGASGTGRKLCVGLRKSFGLRKKEGGISSIYTTVPAFQTGWQRWGGGRGVPDVSLVADPNTGVGVAYGQYWYWVGGTSAGAP